MVSSRRMAERRGMGVNGNLGLPESQTLLDNSKMAFTIVNSFRVVPKHMKIKRLTDS
jgi:hypothetical protein